MGGDDTEEGYHVAGRRYRFPRWLVVHVGFYRAAMYLFLLEAICLFLLAAALIGVVLFARNYCWFDWDKAPITVSERFYRYHSAVAAYTSVEQGVPPVVVRGSDPVILGVALQFKQSCYCQDLFAEIGNYQQGVETIGGGTLEPLNGDVTRLEGMWLRPLPGWYVVELVFKCKSQGNKIVGGPVDFATFNVIGDWNVNRK